MSVGLYLSAATVAKADRVRDHAPSGGRKPPFNWSCSPVGGGGADGALSLRWDYHGPCPDFTDGALLRLSIAIDDRGTALLEARTASGENQLRFDVRYAHPIQPFEIALNPVEAREIFKHGLDLHLADRSDPLYIFTQCADGESVSAPDALLPHLLPLEATGCASASSDLVLRHAPFSQRLKGPESNQVFGWMEGCVLEGLMALARQTGDRSYTEAASEHLARYFRGNSLVYVDDYSQSRLDSVYGIEGSLPYAAMAELDPYHPGIDLALAFWNARRREKGLISDENFFSTEGVYTVAYPLAKLARLRGDKALAAVAVAEAVARVERLKESGIIWLRQLPDRSKAFPNWSRGVAWYLLGLAGVARSLDGFYDVKPIVSALADGCELALSQQRHDGLFGCFIDRADSEPDTAGSAGIWAACCLAVSMDAVTQGELADREHALAALSSYLAPDGFLRGVAQSNKGGMALQTSSYRVIAQFGMGLYAQFIAAAAEL